MLCVCFALSKIDIRVMPVGEWAQSALCVRIYYTIIHFIFQQATEHFCNKSNSYPVELFLIELTVYCLSCLISNQYLWCILADVSILLCYAAGTHPIVNDGLFHLRPNDARYVMFIVHAHVLYIREQLLWQEEINSKNGIQFILNPCLSSQHAADANIARKCLSLF